MPRFAELQERFVTDDDSLEMLDIALTSEETLVSDVRSHLSPAQVVEQKLVSVQRRDANFSSGNNARTGRIVTVTVGTRPRKPR